MKSCLSLLAALALLLPAGCATKPHARPQPLTGDPIVDAENAIASGPERDRVLWQYRAALASLRAGKFEGARHYFDDALARISNIYGQDESARKARGYFNAEAKKTFIGEPYERTMAYFYRGILYWMDGEPDNARACFRSGEIMDGDTEEKAYAGDYVLLDYLDGYISTRLGADGSDAVKRAQANSKMWRPPVFGPKANVLVFIDYGPGPKKYATGQYGEELRFAGGVSPAISALVKVGSMTGKAVPYDDLYYQATTRGGRVMDHILGNKAVFKTSTDVAGTAAIFSGAVLGTSRNRDAQYVGLGLIGAGLVSKIFSAATTPEADVRAWDNLPLYISFVALELPPGQQTLTVEFLDGQDKAIANLTKTVTLAVPANGQDKVIYVSDRSPSTQTL